MKGKRLINISKVIGKYLFRVMTLLLATSIVAFVLVSLSPIDPVQQYVMGAGAVSMEQRETISEYWGLNAPPTEIPTVVSNSARRYGSILTANR